MYLLVAIEITSLLRHRMSNRAWHAVHLLSYFLFATTTVHMLTAGTDVKALVAVERGGPARGRRDLRIGRAVPLALRPSPARSGPQPRSGSPGRAGVG